MNKISPNIQELARSMVASQEELISMELGSLYNDTFSTA
jgi:hypothetical protein